MTYSRYATVQVNPDKVEGFKRFHSEQIMTGCRGIAGFEGLQLLINPKTGQGYSVTLWETRDAGRAALEPLAEIRDRGAEALEAMGFISDFVAGFELVLDEKA